MQAWVTSQRGGKSWLGCCATIGPGERKRLQEPDVLHGEAGVKHAMHSNSSLCSM